MYQVIIDAISTSTTQIISIFGGVLPLIMVVFAGLVGLAFALRLFSRLVGRKA